MTDEDFTTEWWLRIVLFISLVLGVLFALTLGSLLVWCLVMMWRSIVG